MSTDVTSLSTDVTPLSAKEIAHPVGETDITFPVNEKADTKERKNKIITLSNTKFNIFPLLIN
mgnify:FL=1